MGKYTILDDPTADQVVQDVLDIVLGEIIRLMGEYVQAIVLTGGYGRGEGGVCLSEGGYRLVNDLDLAVFVEKDFKRIKKQYTPRLKALATSLQPKARGIKQIDMDITSINRYRFRPNLVNNYEIKQGHQVLFGSLDLAKVMPNLVAENLPVFDGTTYFYSRGSGLLLPALYLVTGSLKHAALQENFQIELQKACQAMGDALLLKLRRYHCSYRERLRRFESLERDLDSDLKRLYEEIAPWYAWGVHRKLEPQLNWPGNDQMRERFFEIRDVFSRFFLWFESGRLGKSFTNWEQYSKFTSKSGIREPWDVKARDLVKRSVELKKPVFKTKTAMLLPIMPLLLFSFEEEDKAVYLAQARKLLPHSKMECPDEEWVSLTKAYLKRFHPGGVVADAIRL